MKSEHPIVDAPACLREAFALHQAFRRLGFPASALFFLVATCDLCHPYDGAHVKLAWEGKVFITCTGRARGWSGKKLVARWRQMVDAQVSLTEDEWTAVWTGSDVHKKGVDLATALLVKGIRAPCPRRTGPRDSTVVTGEERRPAS